MVEWWPIGKINTSPVIMAKQAHKSPLLLYCPNWEGGWEKSRPCFNLSLDLCCTVVGKKLLEHDEVLISENKTQTLIFYYNWEEAASVWHDGWGYFGWEGTGGIG